MGKLHSRYMVAGGIATTMAVGAVGLYLYYSKEEKSEAHSDFKDEQVVNILEDLRVEFTPTLIHWYQVYQQLKEQNQG